MKHVQPVLHKYDITLNLKDYINRPEFRKELSRENKLYQVPIYLQDSLAIFLKPNLIIEGHVPLDIIDTLLNNYANLPKHKLIAIYQPEMHSNAKEVTLYISGYEPEKLSVNEDFVNIIHGKVLKEDKGTLNGNMITPLVMGAIS